MKHKVTPRQRQVLLLIRDYTQANGFPPSRRDILADLGAESTNTVACLLKILVREQLILIAKGKARGIRITEAGIAVLGAG